MNVAVTGGTGFVGNTLVERLAEDAHEMRVLTRNPAYKKEGVIPFVGDLLDSSVELDQFVQDVDVLFHCCGELTNETNMKSLHIDGTKKLLHAASGNVGRWVQLSSVGVYGRHRSGLISEEFSDNPVGEYERTKTESDQLVESSDIPSVLLRPSTVFGHGMPNKSLEQLIHAMTSGHFLYIGKEGAILNYVHVNDVASALILCGVENRSIGQVFNISQSVSIERMVHTICADRQKKKIRRFPELPIKTLATLFGWTGVIPLTRSRVAALTRRCVYDSSKIQEQLGFKFESTLEEQLQAFSCKTLDRK